MLFCDSRLKKLSEHGINSLYTYSNYIDKVLYAFDMGSFWSYYYIHDHLYSPAALVDTSTGAAKERYEYDVYGKVHVLEADFTADADNRSDYGNPYLFTGRRPSEGLRGEPMVDQKAGVFPSAWASSAVL